MDRIAIAVGLVLAALIVGVAILGQEGLNKLFWEPPEPEPVETYTRIPLAPPVAERTSPAEKELLCAIIEKLQNPPDPLETKSVRTEC